MMESHSSVFKLVSGVVAPLALTLAAAGQTTPMTSAPAAGNGEVTNEVVTLEEFSVKSQRDATGWGASEAVSGTRTASAIIDLPYSVSVVTREFMDAFQMKDLDEFGLFISGFTPGEVEAGGGSYQSYSGRITYGQRFDNSSELLLSADGLQSNGRENIY